VQVQLSQAFTWSLLNQVSLLGEFVCCILENGPVLGNWNCFAFRDVNRTVSILMWVYHIVRDILHVVLFLSAVSIVNGSSPFDK